MISAADAPLLSPAWSFSTTDAGGEGDVTGTPVVSRGCVYVATTEGWVFALNADNGELVWKRKLPYGGGVNGSVTAQGKRIYIGVSRLSKAEGCRKGDPCIGPYAVALDRRNGPGRVGDALARRPARIRPLRQPGDLQAGDDARRLRRLGGARRRGRPLRLPGLDGCSSTRARAGAAQDLDDPPAAAARRRVRRRRDLVDAGDRPQGRGRLRRHREPVQAAGRARVRERGREVRRRPQAAAASGASSAPTRATSTSTSLASRSCRATTSRATRRPTTRRGSAPAETSTSTSAPPRTCSRGPDGRKLVGAGQKSGVYHVFDAKTMEPVWTQIVGPPTAVGGIVGSTAYDGESFYGPITVPGYLWSLDAAGGAYRWAAPVADGVHWGNPVAVANGVVYTTDLTGSLNAYDARNGALLAKRPLASAAAPTRRRCRGPASASPATRSTPRSASAASPRATSSPSVRGGTERRRRGRRRDGRGTRRRRRRRRRWRRRPAATRRSSPGPGAASTSYATPVATTSVGGPLDFVNLDLAKHDVKSVEHGADGRPLFSTPLIDLGETAPIEGLDRVSSGRSYEFFCTIHPGMRGPARGSVGAPELGGSPELGRGGGGRRRARTTGGRCSGSGRTTSRRTPRVSIRPQRRRQHPRRHPRDQLAARAASTGTATRARRRNRA